MKVLAQGVDCRVSGKVIRAAYVVKGTQNLADCAEFMETTQPLSIWNVYTDAPFAVEEDLKLKTFPRKPPSRRDWMSITIIEPVEATFPQEDEETVDEV